MTNNKQTIANSFNDFYINIGPNICKNRPMSHTSPMTYMGSRINDSMFIESATEMEIRRIILSLKNSAAGWDDISAKIVKQTYA